MALSLRTSASSLMSPSSLHCKTQRSPRGSPCTVSFSPSSSPRRLGAECSSRGTPRWTAVPPSVVPGGSQLKDAAAEVLHNAPVGLHSGSSTTGSVPVYVMLPLDTVSPPSSTGGGLSLSRARALNASLMALRNAGVEGVMVDVWWGLVEREGPSKYDWEPYVELVRMVQRHGLKLQMVMSFHQCGGNVGDSCSIPLPPWVVEEMGSDPDIFYTDRSGRRNPEYISLGCDSLPVLKGRTPIQAYSDFMLSFRDRFKEFLGDVIVEIQVGMGPCGELRYPSYPESNGTWKYPGIGEFQCYDKYMLGSLRASAIAVGRKEWGEGGPHDAGTYNQFPEETGFFRREGSWSSDYGRFFLDWYSTSLLEHGGRVLAAAEAAFRGDGVKLSAKVAGIHWHYRTRSHAAELTAGYYNTRQRDGYLPVARALARRGAVLNFTCMEMRDEEQPGHADSSPELLVRQVKAAARAAGVEVAGENALQRYDDSAFSQVVATAGDEAGAGLCAFTYLRMNKDLFEGENWRRFVDFVGGMSEGARNGAGLQAADSTGSYLYVGLINTTGHNITNNLNNINKVGVEHSHMQQVATL